MRPVYEIINEVCAVVYEGRNTVCVVPYDHITYEEMEYASEWTDKQFCSDERKEFLKTSEGTQQFVKLLNDRLVKLWKEEELVQEQHKVKPNVKQSKRGNVK